MNTNKRLLLLGGAVVALSIAVTGGFALIGDSASAEGRIFTERSLFGEYRFHIFEVRLTETGEFDFCDETGTAVFDGTGFATAISTRRCSLPPRVEDDTGELTYVVFPDGQVEFTDVDGPEGTTNHGWIVDNGRIVLVDGTTRRPPGFDVIAVHGMGAKQGRPRKGIRESDRDDD